MTAQTTLLAAWSELVRPDAPHPAIRLLQSGAPCALLLDYDGTLAPFMPSYDQAVPFPGVRERLRGLQSAAGARTVLVTGRPCLDALRFLDLDPAPEIWGCHGGERRLPSGRVFL